MFSSHHPPSPAFLADGVAVAQHRQHRKILVSSAPHPRIDRKTAPILAEQLRIMGLASTQSRMSKQRGSSSSGSAPNELPPNGSTPNGSTPNGLTPTGSTASQPDLLDLPVLRDFAELNSNLVEARESSKPVLQLSYSEIGFLRDSVHSLDLKLSALADRFDASAKQNLEASSTEIVALRESLGGLDLRLSAIAQWLDDLSKKTQLALSGEIVGLKESVAILNGRLSALVEQSVEERKARIHAEARTASLEQQIASGNQLAELDLAVLQQALATTRSQCQLLEAQHQALAIKVEGLNNQVDQAAPPASSPSNVGSLDQDRRGSIPLSQPQSLHDQSNDHQNGLIDSSPAASATSHGAAPALGDDSADTVLLDPVQKPQDQINDGMEELLPLSTAPGMPPRPASASSNQRNSSSIFPLFVGGVAASALVGGGLLFVGPKLLRQPEPVTPATSVPASPAQTVSLPPKPLAASAKKGSTLPAPATAVSKPAPPAADRLKIHCPEVCWVEVRRVADGKTLYDSLLKGSVQFPIGKGLNVSSGRSDILKLKINNNAPFVLNPQQMLSAKLIKPPS